MEAAVLGLIDYLVIAATLCISVGIGVYYRFSGDQQKTTKEYFSANKSMGILPISIALTVSFMSTITLLGVSAENYIYGTQFVVTNFSYLIGIPFVCYGYLPVFHKLGAISAYEYLDKRFGYGARLATSFANWIQLLLYSGVVLYAPALALEATTGFSRVWSIVAIGLVCAFYSTIGGIKAVLITDVFQAILMFVSLLIIIGSATQKMGGLTEIWRIASDGGRIEFDNISVDPTVRHTWWSLIIGGLFNFLSLFAVNQVQVQRMMTLKNLKSARISLWLHWPSLMCLSAITCFCGLVIYSYYRDCDPLDSGRIKTSGMLMPLYVMDTLSNLPGIPGLFIAGIFSAGLSTISAGLNSLALLTLEDYVKPFYKRFSKHSFSETKSVMLSKLLVMFFGITCIALAFLAEYLGGILQTALTIFGTVGGPVLGIFTLGMSFESANQFGAVTGLLTSLAFTFWIAFGQPRPFAPELPRSTDGCHSKIYFKNFILANQTKVSELFTREDSSYFYLYRISYMWYSAIGFFVTLFIGLSISYLSRNQFKNKNEELDPDLFFPCIAKRIRRRKQRTELELKRNSP